MGWKRVLPTVRCPVVQFNPVQQACVAFATVPRAGFDFKTMKVRSTGDCLD